MIRCAVLVLVVACSWSAGPEPVRYREPEPPHLWCQLAPGAYAFEYMPSTVPTLVQGCARSTLRVPTTLEELVVDPGHVVELAFGLPDRLRDAGCILDSVVLVHGRSNDGLSIDIRAGDVTTPVITYGRVPGMFAQRVNDRVPRDIDLYAVRHHLGVAAPNEVAIVVRSDHRFTLAVRSRDESQDLPLLLDGQPTRHVPQAAIILSHCRLPAAQALDALRR